MTRADHPAKPIAPADSPGPIPARPPLGWIGSALGLGRTLTVQGVRYRQLRTSPGSAGRRVCEYAVRFPQGDRMRIRPTPHRIYPDLIGRTAPPLLPILERIITPGQRVALLGSGTGQDAWWIGMLVGPSGGVVALERDGESVRYARRRYLQAVQPLPIAYEIGGIESLRGELDSSFDSIIVNESAGHSPPETDAQHIRRELVRVLMPGGWLLGPTPIVSPGDASSPLDAPPTPMPSARGLTLVRKPHSRSTDQHSDQRDDQRDNPPGDPPA